MPSFLADIGVGMENLVISFNVVLPIFICIALGYFLKRIHMLGEETLKQLNKLCFKVFLPVYLFNNIYTTNLTDSFNGKLLLVAICGLLGWFIILMIIIPLVEKEDSKRGVMVQGIFRSNFALFGLPVAISLCGEENVGPTSLLIGIVVPVFNVLAVITLEIFRGGKPSMKKMIKGVVTNPLILASLVGILCNGFHLHLPSAVEKAAVDIGRVATPLSLIALGGSFTFSKIKRNLTQLTICVMGKLIISPLVMVIVGIVFGFRNEFLVPVLIMFGAPTAVSSFPMAQQMDGDGELAAEVVVFTSAFAILTIFLWVFALKQLQYI